MQRKLVGFLLFIIPCIAISQNVEIKGNALFFANQKIEAIQYSNRISKDLKTIASETISEEGNYHLKFTLNKPSEILIQIEMRLFSILVHPESIIEINFLPIENASNQKVPFRTGVKYLKHPNKTATIFDYQNLEIAFAEYQAEIEFGQNIFDFYVPFFDSVETTYKELLQNDTLFLNHYTYFKAKALLQTEQSHQQIFNTYFENKEIQYLQEDYLRVFSTITGIRLYNYFKKNQASVQKATSQYQVYKEMLHLLSSDSVFINSEIQNLALLFYCMHPKTLNEVPQQTWTGIINQMANFCPYPEIKNAAISLQVKKNKLSIGNEAPTFELINTQGQFKPLTDFRGRHTYLGFINSKSRTSVQDVQAIAQLKKKYSKVNYLFVICDRDSIEIQNLPKESSNLKYLFINKDYTVLKEYEIWNYPVYYLLDKHGYFLQSPAGRPMEIIDDFAVIFAKKSGRKRYEIIKD